MSEERCCNKHHYTCAASFDEFPPDRCCHNCPCYPDHPEWVGSDDMIESAVQVDDSTIGIVSFYGDSVTPIIRYPSTVEAGSYGLLVVKINVQDARDCWCAATSGWTLNERVGNEWTFHRWDVEPNDAGQTFVLALENRQRWAAVLAVVPPGLFW